MAQQSVVIKLETGGETVPAPSVPAGLNLPPEHTLAPVHEHIVATEGKAPAIWLLGAHGGAGVSTLEASWAPARDARGGWPAADKMPYVVVVTRTHMTGLSHAHTLLRQAAAHRIGACRLLGLVTVADAPGRLPSSLRHRLQVVSAAAPAVWSIPWIDAYRLVTADQLPVWLPSDEVVEGRKRTIRPLEAVHPKVAEVGTAIFAAAREAHVGR